MNDFENNAADGEDLSMPEEQNMDDAPASGKMKRGMSPMAKIAALGAVAIAVVGAGSFYNVSQGEAVSAVAGAPNVDSTPGGAVQADNIRYQERIAASNDAKSAKAAEIGVTFIPTSEAILEPIEKTEVLVKVPDVVVVEEVAAEVEPVEREVRRIEIPKIPKPEPQKTEVVMPDVEVRQPVERTPVATQSGPPGEEPENPFTQAIGSQMAAVSKLQQSPRSEITGTAERRVSKAAAAQQEASSAPQAPAQDGVAGSQGSAEVVLRPGDVIYGETITSNNSDANAPVLVEITTGKFKGARLVGSYTLAESSNKMIVAFNRMTLENGDTLDINAFAVDGVSAETAVASDVDRRLVKRYAPIFAATFLSAYAAAAGQPAQSVSEDGTVVNVSQSSEREAAFAGVGAATAVIGADIAATAPKGPLVKLDDGYPLGILIIEPVLVEN